MKNTDNKSALDIVRDYYNNWTRKNYDDAAGFLDENIQFEMPINQYETAGLFMQAVRFTGDNASNISLLAEFGNDSEAVLIYDFIFSPVGQMRIAEHFKTRNGKIIFIRHIHDTYQLRMSGLFAE